MKNIMLCHVHRKGIIDYIWQVGNNIVIDDNFNLFFYAQLFDDERTVINLFGPGYNLDNVISIIEEKITNDDISEDLFYKYEYLLRGLYYLRRENAMEEGRKIFAPSAPSRMHSIFLTDEFSLPYWQATVGDNNYETFQLETYGNLFVSSDDFFPYAGLTFDNQVEASKAYWQPKIDRCTLHKEFVFQGRCRIISKK